MATNTSACRLAPRVDRSPSRSPSLARTSGLCRSPSLRSAQSPSDLLRLHATHLLEQLREGLHGVLVGGHGHEVAHGDTLTRELVEVEAAAGIVHVLDLHARARVPRHYGAAVLVLAEGDLVGPDELRE